MTLRTPFVNGLSYRERAHHAACAGRFFRIAACLVLPTLVACHARRPDVAEESGRLTGLNNALVFHENSEDMEAASRSPRALSLEQAVRLALTHDPRVQSALATVRSAEADANQARLLPNPILNIDVRVPQQPGINTAVEATLTGDLVGLLQKPGLIAAADKRLRASACNALVVVLDLIGEVEESYGAAQSADEEIQNAQGRLEILTRLRAMAQERLKAGEAARLDVLTFDAQEMQFTLDLADLRHAATLQRLHLARLIGEPRAALDWQLSAVIPPDEKLAAESAWIEAALKNRPEIRSKMWELKALGDDLSAAALAPFVGGDIGAHTEHDPEWRTGPSLTIPLPIFDFGQASRAKIQAQRAAARGELLRQQREIIQDVRSAYAEYLHTGETLAATRKQLLPLQQQQLEQAQRAYQAGESDLTTLLQAESENQLALSRAIELREKFIVARGKLQRAAGGAAVASPLFLPSPNSQPDTPPTSRPAEGSVP